MIEILEFIVVQELASVVQIKTRAHWIIFNFYFIQAKRLHNVIDFRAHLNREVFVRRIFSPSSHRDNMPNALVLWISIVDSYYHTFNILPYHPRNLHEVSLFLSLWPPQICWFIIGVKLKDLNGSDIREHSSY